MNSNIVISMDQKNRHTSQYMKNVKNNIKEEEVKAGAEPAGSGNLKKFTLDGGGNHGGGHLNMSRRRILNDFASSPDNKSKDTGLNGLVNRNRANILKMPMPRTNNAQSNMGYYDSQVSGQ